MSTLKVTNIKAADGTSALSIADSTGKVSLATGSDLALQGTGKVFAPNGIVFSSTELTGDDASTTTRTETSNLLDDYEEGTWTLTNGDFGTFTSVTATAKYIKIGNLVFVYFRQTAGTIDPTAAPKYLTGLPFVPDASAGSGTWSHGAVTMNVTGLISGSSGEGRIFTPVDFGSNTNLYFSGTYYTS